MMTKHFSRVTVIALLLIYCAVSIASALQESLTFDEIVHIEEGLNAWKKHEFLVDTNNPPLIREIAVLPLILRSQHFIISQQPNMQALPARFIIILLGVVLGLSIYVVASRLFSEDVGSIALLLYVFDPNILAHSHYITQDLGATLFFFFGYMSLVWVLLSRTWISFVIHGICVGLMALSKITTLPYYLLADIIVVVYLIRRNVWGWLLLFPKQIATSALICMIVIWSAYFFRTSVVVAPGNAQGRVSTALRSIGTKQNNRILIGTMDFLEKTPVPLGDYIAVMKNTVIRSTRKPSEVFFMGSFYDRVKWHFMPVNVFAKTPLPLLMLFTAGVWSSLINKKFRKISIILLIPACSVLIVSSVSGMQPLVRYVLPLYPFVFILAGLSISGIKNRFTTAVLLMVVIWHIAGSLGYFPHFISYANELYGPRERMYEKFTDSNLDWGQSLPDFAAYIQKTKPFELQFSYFGRDDASKYGFMSDFPFGSYKFNEICAFHSHSLNGNAGSVTGISVSNWYACGYYRDPLYSGNRIKDFIGGSIIVL